MSTSNTFNTLVDVMSDIRNFMYGGMVSLPVTIAGTMLILGLFTGNYAFLFFLLGFLVVTPFYCVSLYIQSKRNFDCIYTSMSDYVKTIIEKKDNDELSNKLEDIKESGNKSDSNSEENDLDEFSYSTIPPTKKGLFNFY